MDKNRRFAFQKVTWRDKDNLRKIKLPASDDQPKFREYLRVIDGSEHPELFLIWLQEYRRAARNNKHLSVQRKKEILLEIVEGGAWHEVTGAIKRCRGSQDDEGKWIKKSFAFQKIPLQEKLKKMKDDALQKYGDSEEYAMDAITEAVHALKIAYFGDHVVGRNSYHQLQHQMHNLRVDFNTGIRMWDMRMCELNSYLPDMPCEALEKRGETARAMTEMEMRKMLFVCLQEPHRQQLIEFDWDVLEKDYRESIQRLGSLEPAIRHKLEFEKELRELKEHYPLNTKRKSNPKKESGRPFNKKKSKRGKKTR